MFKIGITCIDIRTVSYMSRILWVIDYDSSILSHLEDRIIFALNIYESSIMIQDQDRILSAFYIYDSLIE